MKYLAILPSNQDRNLYANYPLSEFVVLHQIANACEDYGKGIRGLTVRAIKGMPESKDVSKLQGLYRQVSDAVNWLKSVGADSKDCAMLNIHSDSGSFRHLFGCYGGGSNSPSHQLSTAVVNSVESLMRTRLVRFLDYSEYVFYRNRGPFNSALVELGSHQNQDDIAFLLNRQEELAKAVVDGAASYLGTNLPLEPTTPEEEYFSLFGIPCNPEAAIYRYWRECYRLGDIASLGPAIKAEENGDPYGESGHIIQRFANGIVVTHPEDGWKCFRATICLEPKKWFPE